MTATVTGRPVCTAHGRPVAMKRLSADRFLRAVAPDGARGPALDTGTGPNAGAWICPTCGRIHPQLPLPGDAAA